MMRRSKNSSPSLFAALLVGLLANVLLRSQSGYWSRAGLITAPFAALALAGAGWLFARCWRIRPTLLNRWLLASVLAGSAALEILRLWQLFGRAYPGETTLLVVSLMVLAPVIYLRRQSAIAQTANVVLSLLVVACVLMVVSVAPRLRADHLQTFYLQTSDFGNAFASQFVLYPEFLLPALWPDNDKRGSHTLLGLAGLTVGFDVAVNLLLELFFGAALPGRADPVHAAARCGALSVFNRLEWVQLILWSVAVSIKLALYLYALVRLGGHHSRSGDSTAALRHFPVYFGGLLLLCGVLRNTDIAAALTVRNIAVWAVAVFVVLEGGIQCLYKKSGTV